MKQTELIMENSNRENRRKNKCIFTLIEFLIVIAVIAILISILLPTLNKARKTARDSVCKNNLKQIALGINFYIEDYNNWMPANTATGPYVDGWNDVLIQEGYLGTPIKHVAWLEVPFNTFICPEDNIPRNGVLYGDIEKRKRKRCSYASHRGDSWRLCGWNLPFDPKSIRMIRIKEPSNFIMVMEKNDVYNQIGFAYGSVGDWVSRSAFHQRTPYSTNYNFPDGHVELLKSNETHSGSTRWSRSGKWENLSSEWNN